MNPNWQGISPMKNLSYIIIILILSACQQVETDEIPLNATMYVSKLAPYDMDDLRENDEVVLVYSLNSYRASGTLYASKVGIHHVAEVKADSSEEIKQLISVPMVEDGHVSASFGLVEVDESSDKNYNFSEIEEKVHYNSKSFTLFKRYKPDEEYKTVSPSSWDQIKDTFEQYQIDIADHLGIGMVKNNDNLGAFRIDYRNEELPERTSRNEINFTGAQGDSHYRLSFYLNKSPSPGSQNYLHDEVN